MQFDIPRIFAIQKRALLHHSMLTGADDPYSAFPVDDEGTLWTLHEIQTFPSRIQMASTHKDMYWVPHAAAGNLRFIPATPHLRAQCRVRFHIEFGRILTPALLRMHGILVEDPRIERHEPCCRTNALGYGCPCVTPAFIPEQARKTDPYRDHEEPVIHHKPVAPDFEVKPFHPLAYWSGRNPRGGVRVP